MSDGSTDWQSNLPLEAQQLREVFIRFGLAAYQAQCVERQIGILLATTHNPNFLRVPPEDRDTFFNREFAKTLGRLVQALRERASLSSEFEPRLRHGLKVRNWLMHDYFWERAGSILTWDGREQMIAELQQAADLLSELDDELTRTYESWAASFGMTPEIIAKELEKYRRGENA